MNKRYNKLLTLMLSVLMTLAFTVAVHADDVEYPATYGTLAQSYEGKTVVLSSNDVHGAVDGYQYIAGLKAELVKRGADVIMVDAGDFSQGTTYVSTTKGAEAVNLMRLSGYDYATLGNHEFDFGPVAMNKNIDAAEAANGEYGTPVRILCSNILNNDDDQPTYTPSDLYTKESMGDLKVGFIGVATPETQTKSIPTNFENVYFNARNDQEVQNLYDDLNARVAQLRDDGADVVIVLAHLGVDAESEPFRSVDLQANMTNKADLIIDGHSHTVMTAGENEEPVMSTGTKFKNIGVTVIDEATEKIETRFLYHLRDEDGAAFPENAYSDSTVKAYADNLISTIDAEYAKKVAETKVHLNGEKEFKNHIYGNRDGETNLGDLITDSMLWYVTKEGTDLGVPAENVVAITNGGGIRATIPVGDISKANIKTVLPFGNTIAAITIKGSQMLEALEASTQSAPGTNGGFPQIAGMNIKIDTSKAYDKQDTPYPGSSYYGPKTIKRVTITDVNGNDFNPDADYVVLSNNFTAAGGDTYYAFKEVTNQFDTSIPLDDALTEYIVDYLNAEVDTTYENPQGRIIFTDPALDTAVTEAEAAMTEARDNGTAEEYAAAIEAYADAAGKTGDPDKIAEAKKDAKLVDELRKAQAEKKAAEEALAQNKKDAEEALAAANAALKEAEEKLAKLQEQAATAAADSAAKEVKTVTVNDKTVDAKAIDNAVKKAGGSEKYVTKIVLGKKVSKISASAFKKYTKVTTLEIKSKKLKKAKVKKSLKGSKVKTVKVNVGKKKANKKYVKKYKKIFTKKNAGKKVKIK